MARRLLSILLLFLYLIPSIGVQGSVHYCSNEIAAIVILPTDKHPCACDPLESMDDTCCKDKHFSVKIKDNHKSVDSKIAIEKITDFALVRTTYSLSCFIVPLDEEKELAKVEEKEPPDIKLFILYESYLI